MNTNQFETQGTQVEHNKSSNMHSSSFSLFSCLLDALSLLFSSLKRDGEHHTVTSQDKFISESNARSSNITAQKQFRQLPQIKGQ